MTSEDQEDESDDEASPLLESLSVPLTAPRFVYELWGTAGVGAASRLGS